MTKFAAPVLRDGHVCRPRLVERLAAGARGTLTLVSGAAGTGKTALLAEWGATVTSPVAWLSTDGGKSFNRTLAKPVFDLKLAGGAALLRLAVCVRAFVRAGLLACLLGPCAG